MTTLLNSFEQTKKEYVEAFEKNGHVFQLDQEFRPGEIDWMAYSPDGHNGPSCTRCGQSWCMFCTAASKIVECKPRTEER
jgi:hypothetical protein